MMRAGISVFIVLIGLSVMVHGQVDLNRKRPEEQPKEFPAAPRKTATPQVAPPPSTPVEGAAAVSFPVVKAIVFIRSYDVDFKKAPAATNGIIIPPELTLIEHPKVRTMLAPYLGQSLDPAKISAMENSLWEFCRDVRKNPLVAIAVPPPTAAARDLGIVQVVFVDGKISDLSIRNEGHVWFSTNFIRNHIRQATNQSFNQRVFDLDLEALNSNPFLGLGYTLKPGLVPATTDLEVEVKDRFPVRPYVGFEDTGTELLGRNRFLAGGNWGNAFGWGHQLNYQYMADIEFRHLSAHSASYILPLPWRHRLEFSGSYVTAKATPSGLRSTRRAMSGWLVTWSLFPVARDSTTRLGWESSISS